MMGDRDVIEMKGEPGDDGEIRYASAPPRRPPSPLGGWIAKVVGAAAGVAIFLALLFFFVYVVVPIVCLAIVWAFLRSAFRPRR